MLDKRLFRNNLLKSSKTRKNSKRVNQINKKTSRESKGIWKEGDVAKTEDNHDMEDIKIKCLNIRLTNKHMINIKMKEKQEKVMAKENKDKTGFQDPPERAQSL